MMRRQVHIDDAEKIVRADELPLLVPGEVAERKRAEAIVAEQYADRARIFRLVFFLPHEPGARRVSSTSARQRRRQPLASGGDNGHVQSGDRDLVARLDLQGLSLG